MDDDDDFFAFLDSDSLEPAPSATSKIPAAPKKSFFHPETVKQVMRLYFNDDRTKMMPEALKLLTGLFQAFVEEALQRVVRQAEIDHVDVITPEHFQKILPQLMLDFT